MEQTLINRFGLKDRVLDEITKIARQNEVEKLVLFGSRARGDYKEKSDIDLAFWGGNSASFIVDVNEDTYTLLQFDVIDMEGPLQKELRDSIEAEGVVIYEKNGELQEGLSQSEGDL